MLIDCDTCVVRGPACGDCVVTVLLGFPVFGRQGPDDGPGVPEGVDVGDTVAAEALDLDQAEQAAIAVLAGSGLVPPLRLVPGAAAGEAPTPHHGAPARRAAEAG
ncbi:hypothetical protein [Kineosporia sp. R_H_3]|uniref:hypothetical protein n=1 Tax=Kineosporia sp. R_H_3 TaxID=1961848 RepID=UPI001E58CA4C|nr:hypothetical protein [Kineosporia sp. R_H_3]